MTVCYDKLFRLLKERNIRNIELTRMCGFSGNIMTRLKRNQFISLENVGVICRVLDCKVDDILEFEEEENKILINTCNLKKFLSKGEANGKK